MCFVFDLQIRSVGRYVIENRGLLIKNVSESDDGLYTCRAAVISTGELAKRVIRVEVQIKPEVQKLPPILDAVEGQSFSFLCNATGKPVPEFQWIKKSTQQNVADIDRYARWQYIFSYKHFNRSDFSLRHY